MLEFSIAILVGLIILVWSADYFVNASIAAALSMGMTPMMIGLTIVAFGTSAPEMIVSTTAALSNASDLAVGNAIGSNIANIGLVLGITALISAIPLRRIVLKRELPALLLTTIVASLLLLDGKLSIIDGLLMIAMLISALIFFARKPESAPELLEEVEHAPKMSIVKALMQLLISLALLIGSSKLLVWGASGVAYALGVSELIVGLTIVAIGTSLPELAASVASALKGHHDLALGNVIGSNLFNLLAVMAIPSLFATVDIPHSTLVRDYGTMTALTFALALLAYIMLRHHKQALSRSIGLLFLGSYIAYMCALYISALDSLAG